MNSIRKKLFFQIGMLIFILISISIFANTFFSKFYYDYRLKSSLTDYFTELSSMKPEEYTSENLERFEMASNIDLSISDRNGNIIYDTREAPVKPYEMDSLMNEKKKNHLDFKKDVLKTLNISEDAKIVWTNDPKTKIRMVVLSGEMDNGCSVIMRLPLFPIEQNVNQSNTFALYIGIIMLPVGMIFAYSLSKSFTKPILHMNRKTTQLKRLNFESVCEVYSNDELGELAQNINEMSSSLSDSIDSLNKLNRELQIEISENNLLHEKRKELLNNVSHELKTPLTLMQGYAEGLKLNVAKDMDKTEFYCDVIIDETKKMNSLVQSLLTINRLEHGDNLINKSYFNLSSFVNNVASKYFDKFNQENINLSLDIPFNVTVIGDQLRLEQVLTNYINNAIQYVNSEKKITISLDKSFHKPRVIVYNTCDPIPESDLPKLWGTFYKRDKSRARDLGGYGLGLSIVKSIMDAHKNGYGLYLSNNGIHFWFDIDSV